MSASNEWMEWHLTPAGWVAGSAKLDFKKLIERETPQDRVLTCKYREHMSSSFSQVTKIVVPLWNCGDRSRVGSLLQQHGPCPKEISA